MFRKIIPILLLFLTPLMACAFCEDSPPKDKIYVQLEDLFFAPDGIWYKNPFTRVSELYESIHVDFLGYYVTKEQEFWVCGKCGKINRGKPYGWWGCMKCSWPYDGDITKNL